MSIEAVLIKKINDIGPVSIAEFMRTALYDPNHGYYTTGHPVGKNGDFITAPEISQLFGEMTAVYITQHWQAIDKPTPFTLVEMGAGRGTWMGDIMRTLKTIAPDLSDNLHIHIVETSPTLTTEQQDTLKDYDVSWHTVFTPPDTPYLLIGNEILDAFPIHQFEKIQGRWHERHVTYHTPADATGNGFSYVALPCDEALIPEACRHNDFYEWNDQAEHLVTQIAATAHGHALLIDYGYTTHDGLKDTLQAVKNHAYHPVLSDLGQADLTAQVPFARLLEIAREHGRPAECLTQADFLSLMGIHMRAKTLMAARPDKKGMIDEALNRLLSPSEMGTLFKVFII